MIIPMDRSNHSMYKSKCNRRVLAKIERSLTSISSRYTTLDRARAVAKLVKANYEIQQRDRALPVTSVRPWLRRFYGINLSPQQCGAIVTLLPEYIDPMTPISAIAQIQAQDHNRRIHSSTLIEFCAQLAHIHRGTVNKKFDDVQDNNLFEIIPLLLTKLLALSIKHPISINTKKYVSIEELCVLRNLKGILPLDRLLSELSSQGLRKSSRALLASTLAALQQLKLHNLNESLLASLEALARRYIRHVSHETKKLLRALQRNICIAAAKVSYWPDKANHIERSLRTLCQQLHRRAKESNYRQSTNDDKKKLKLQRLRDELIDAHKTQAERRYFIFGSIQLNNDKALYELQRLERYQKATKKPLKIITCNKSATSIDNTIIDNTSSVCPQQHEAAIVLSRFLTRCTCRLLRRRLAAARSEWQQRLENRARIKLGIIARRWLNRKLHEARLSSITPEMRFHAKQKIAHSLLRYAHRRRGRAILEAEAKRRQVAARAAAATQTQRNNAAAKLQAGYRARKARDRAKELVADREQCRVVLLQVRSASRLLIADSKIGTSDPKCIVTAQLGTKRGGYAPRGFGPSTLLKNHVTSAFATSPKRKPILGGEHLRDSKDKPPSLFLSNTVWLPPTIRARDYDKFEALPPSFPVFSASSSIKDQTLDPVWNETFLIAGGLDPESSISLTVVDVDTIGKDDLLGQAVISLNELRKISSSQYTLLPKSIPNEQDDDSSKIKKQRAICLMDTFVALGTQILPVHDGAHTQVFFESVQGFDRGTISYRIFVPPRAYSITSYLEERISRENSMVSFWKPCWCALGLDQFLIFNNRGDIEPRCVVHVEHIDAVDVIKESEDEILFAFSIAGGLRHIFRVPEIGYPNQEQLRHTWVRRLRRVSPRIPTNEFVPADCTHSQFLSFSLSQQSVVTSTTFCV
uniref:C2 domain-containing protein n=1 Tax=Aureoumbra lagunensis TaxID=44058 RepID=A0A7S3NQV0_9STRA